jgi:hypothetical protein
MAGRNFAIGVMCLLLAVAAASILWHTVNPVLGFFVGLGFAVAGAANIWEAEEDRRLDAERKKRIRQAGSPEGVRRRHQLELEQTAPEDLARWIRERLDDAHVIVRTCRTAVHDPPPVDADVIATVVSRDDAREQRIYANRASDFPDELRARAEGDSSIVLVCGADLSDWLNHRTSAGQLGITGADPLEEFGLGRFGILPDPDE